MSNTVIVKEDQDSVVNAISLKHFPGKLRKVGKVLLQSNEPLSLKEASERAGVSYHTVREEIYRHRKKGNDFHEFIHRTADEYLNENLLAVDRSTLEGAVSGTHNDRKLYYQRIGKLAETTVNTQVTLAIGVNIQSVQPQDSTRPKGVLDTEAFIPKGK